MLEANRTLEPTLDSGKCNGADGAVVVTTSRWSGMLVFLLVIVVLLSRLLLDHLLPHERDKPCLQGFIVPEILTSLFLQLLTLASNM
jgi:hypothetical protein